MGVIASELEPTSLGSQVAGHFLSLPIGEAKSLDLRVFLDHSILEVYANGTVCVTRIIYADPADDGLEPVLSCIRSA